MSEKAKLLALHPVLPAQDVRHSLEFYVDDLGFELAFLDNPQNPTYAGIRRGMVEIHLQLMPTEDLSPVQPPIVRVYVKEVDKLFDEYVDLDIFPDDPGQLDTEMGTREFSLLDPDGNMLTFYQDEE
ncbi:MAG: hypothetical protein KDC34_02560 [Saprospiraceae bacterium]|nr:hypothetical protein [Saprospiraceae bacterium]